MKKLISLIFLVSCGLEVGNSSDESSVDDHSDNSTNSGLVTCNATVEPVVGEDGITCKVVFYSLNGGVCSEQVFANLEDCNQLAEETPEIVVEPEDVEEPILTL